MAQLIYSAIASLDGFVEDRDGRFDWAEPDEEVLAFVNDLERPVGTYLSGRRMYETMLYWENGHLIPDQPALDREFTEIWQGAEKIVYSRTLESVASVNTRIERHFTADAVRHLKVTAEHDLTVGGARPDGRRRRPGRPGHQGRAHRRVASVRRAGRCGRR